MTQRAIKDWNRNIFGKLHGKKIVIEREFSAESCSGPDCSSLKEVEKERAKYHIRTRAYLLVPKVKSELDS